jgi:hypothetical protein
VGVARKDGENGASAALQYLQGKKPDIDEAGLMTNLESAIQKQGRPFVRYSDIQRLEVMEQAEAEQLGVEEFKMSTNEEMLAAMGLA